MGDGWVLLLVAGVIVLAILVVTGGVGATLTRGLGQLGRAGMSRLLHGGAASVQGEVVAARRGIARMTVKVVRIEGDGPSVGLEIHTNAWLGYGIVPVRLHADDALRVAAALDELGKA